MKLSKPELPLRTTLLYLLFGGLWILLSDQILSLLLFHNPQGAVYQTLQSWLFIFVSGILLYILLRKDVEGRQQAEKASQLENARWQEIVEGIADEVWTCDAQGKMCLLNLEAVTAIGLDMFKDRSVQEVYEGVDIFYTNGQPRPPEHAPLLLALHGKIERGEEIMRHRQTGITRYRQFSSAPIRDADGTITGAVAVVRDITDQKVAEEGLRRFELLAAYSRDIILFMHCDDGRILEANIAARHAYGYSQEEMLGLTIRDLRAPDTLGLTAEQMAQADAGGILFETVHLRKDGSTFPVEVSSQGATIGGVRTLISIVRDISERKRTEEEILKLSKFPEENPYPVLRVQNDGQVAYANAASRELLEVWGCEINGYLPEELRNLIRLIVDHASNKTVDVACNDKIYSITLVPIAEGGYVNLYGSDITARKRAEAHVQQLNQELSRHATELEFANEELGIIGERLRITNENLQKEIAEHKGVAEALRQSEERFRFALANSPIIVANLDRGLHYTWVYNPLAGYEAEDLVGKQIGLSADPETKAKILQLLEEPLTHGVSVQWETTIQTGDGVKFLQSQAEPLRSAQGEISGVALVSIDITERKKAEEKVRRSEETLRAVLDQMPSGVTVREAQSGNLVLSNARSKEIMGTLVGSAGQFAQYHGFHADGRPYQAEEWPLWRSMVRGEVVQAEEVAYQRSDGTRMILSINSAPVRDPQGQIVMGVGVFDDITARKQAEEQLHYQAAVLSNVNDAIIASDAQFRLTAWNAAAESLYGWKAEEVIGRNGLEIVRTEWPEGDADEMRRTIAETGLWRGEAAQMRKDGTRFPVEVSSIVLYDNGGRVAGYISVNRDITERKRAEEELHRLLEELKYSNSELEQFAYIASHDLQEPLRMVSSYVQLLARRYQGKLDSDADEFIAFAVDGAKRMQNLINDLLAYSRVGTRGHPLVAISCEEALKEALANLQFAIGESGATITHEPLPEVNGDPTQLFQLFQNLLSNAIKFRGSESPRIQVQVQQEGAEWVFRVCDNGIGLDPKFADRIFVIFQRLHQRDVYPGTGIGLAICKRIVQRHGGRIWVESQPGEGATFYFTMLIKENR